MSLLIAVGIIAGIPKSLGTVIASLGNVTSNNDKLHLFNLYLPVNGVSLLIVSILTAFALIVLYIMVKLNEGQRVIAINYAKRIHGNRAYGGVSSILPIKLITAGVIPVIFAVAFLMLPAFAGQLLRSSANTTWSQLGINLTTWFQMPTSTTFASGNLTTMIYPAIYFLLVVGFTYFYTNIVFNAADIAENMQKQGGFIAEVRPGLQTQKYLSQVVNRLTLFGSLALGVIAVLPFVSEFILAKFGVQAQNLAVGGTGLLIMISVAIETLRQLNSRALMTTYDQDY